MQNSENKSSEEPGVNIDEMNPKVIEAIDSATISNPTAAYADIWEALEEKKKEFSKEDGSQFIELVAGACSISLQPKNVNSPYRPYIQWSDRRSILPEDYTESDLSSLAELSTRITSVKILTRIHDILWISKKPKSIINALEAIKGYRYIFENDDWFEDGKAGYERGLSLCLSIGSVAKAEFDEYLRISEVALSPKDEPSNSSKILSISRILLEYCPNNQIVPKAIERCFELGKKFASDGKAFEARHLLEFSIMYYERKQHFDKLSEAVNLIVDGYLSEASSRDNGIISSIHYEAALQNLRKIPRRMRSKGDVDRRISEIELLIRESGLQSLLEMSKVTSGTIDISEIVSEAINSVQDKEMDEALLAFANLHNSPNPDALRASVKKQMTEFPLSHLFSTVQYSSDGRVVSKLPGSGATTSDDDIQMMSEMIKQYVLEIGLVVSGQILPSLEVIRNQHKLTENDFTFLAFHSPFFPKDRAATIGKGIYKGFIGDFCASLYLLTPQFEHLVRYHLKLRRISTSTIDGNGIENEVGMSALMDNPEVEAVFGEKMSFEFRALFTDPSGPNLRNNCAHGLLSDSETQGQPAIYTWWLMFKIAYNTFHNAHNRQEK